MKITIPKPCHENWEAITPAEKGRFCSVCSKTVRDFTVASDEEIINAFTNSTEEICGIFQESQLNRNLQYSYINSIFVKSAVGFILTTGGLVSVQAQQNCSNDTVKAERLEEVVLIGFPVKKKNENITGGALNKPQEVVVKNIKEKIDGVVVNTLPKDKEIRIGGAHTNLRDDQKPLFILDGKIINFDELSKIDPNSINTIDVIKPDSEKSIFSGSNAKNGIVVLTTEKKK